MANPKPKTENLIQNTGLSPKEARKNGEKGGKASVKARREKKLFRETFETILTMPLREGSPTNVEDVQNYAAANDRNITVQEAITIAMLNKAMSGDVRAAEYIRDTIGQKPLEKVEVSRSIDETVREMNEYFNEQTKTNNKPTD